MGTAYSLGRELRDACRVGNSDKVLELLKEIQGGAIDSLYFLPQGGVNEPGTGEDGDAALGYTPLHLACGCGSLQSVHYLIQYGADVNRTVPATYITPVHQCVIKGFVECLEYLLNHGANINITSSEGLTPCHYAAQLGRRDCLEVLYEYGGDLEAKTHVRRKISPKLFSST